MGVNVVCRNHGGEATLQRIGSTGAGRVKSRGTRVQRASRCAQRWGCTKMRGAQRACCASEG